MLGKRSGESRLPMPAKPSKCPKKNYHYETKRGKLRHPILASEYNGSGAIFADAMHFRTRKLFQNTNLTELENDLAAHKKLTGFYFREVNARYAKDFFDIETHQALIDDMISKGHLASARYFHQKAIEHFRTHKKRWMADTTLVMFSQIEIPAEDEKAIAGSSAAVVPAAALAAAAPPVAASAASSASYVLAQLHSSFSDRKSEPSESLASPKLAPFITEPHFDYTLDLGLSNRAAPAPTLDTPPTPTNRREDPYTTVVNPNTPLTYDTYPGIFFALLSDDEKKAWAERTPRVEKFFDAHTLKPTGP